MYSNEQRRSEECNISKKDMLKDVILAWMLAVATMVGMAIVLTS